jgi:hypothetical protein
MPLRNSSDPTDVARLEAQARLIAAYEEMKWPRWPPSVADLIRDLMDQHGLTHLGCSGDGKSRCGCAALTARRKSVRLRGKSRFGQTNTNFLWSFQWLTSVRFQDATIVEINDGSSKADAARQLVNDARRRTASQRATRRDAEQLPLGFSSFFQHGNIRPLGTSRHDIELCKSVEQKLLARANAAPQS